MADHSLIPALSVSASALDAQSHRMRVIAANVANAQTTRDADGNVYRRRDVVFASELDRKIGTRRRDVNGLRGVRVARTVEDNTPLKRVYRPGHPDADPDGYLTLPNVNPMEEMVDLMVANRSYEANVAAIKTTRMIAQKAMEIGR
jgi:flagellar basal-body rod protein FlgC